MNYGGIGAVVGHEMSHGFDDQGRQFDGSGRTRNWWTEETDGLFVAKTRRLMRQYNNYCPYRDACVNGLGTLGENIGDLAGLEIAYAAYRMSLGGKEAPVIDGLTGDQRFFIAYAASYRDKVREEIARAMLDRRQPRAQPLPRQRRRAQHGRLVRRLRHPPGRQALSRPQPARPHLVKTSTAARRTRFA